MTTLIKDIYSKAFFKNFVKVLKVLNGDINQAQFLADIYNEQWEQKELKQRMRHISIVLKRYLSSSYPQSVQQLLAIISYLQEKNITEQSVEFMFIPDFIEQNGLEYFDTSVLAFEKITQFTSCEFAVRPFVLKYKDKMIQQMYFWSIHKDNSVRRLASEGSRPRLPWAMSLPFLKVNPLPILPILEILKKDNSDYVRRSVANNLNDISKDNPEVVISIIKKWKGANKKTDWILKHGSRTLLKQGHLKVLKLFGFGSPREIKIKNLKLVKREVKIGAYLEFNFELINLAKVSNFIRLEYGVHYQKKNGKLFKKVFKISEKEYPKSSTTFISRKQSFKLMTTRQYCQGIHQLSLIINGVEFERKDFKLV